MVAEERAWDAVKANWATCGLTRIGLDYWDVGGRPLMNRVGRWGGLYRSFSPKALLGPGEDGPVGTVRFEMLREGIQECEARIALEMALVEGSIDAALAQRCSELIAERIRVRRRDGAFGGVGHGPEETISRLWGVAPDWQELTARLFELAGRVQAAAAPRD